MYHPITPVIPLEPTTTTEPSLTYGIPDSPSVLSQSSRATSIFPSLIAWKYGSPSVTLVIFTLQPSLFSSTYLATYVFAVEPDHDCSLMTTVPHAFAPPNALPETASVTARAAPTRTSTSGRRHRRPTRSDIEPSFFECASNV